MEGSTEIWPLPERRLAPVTLPGRLFGKGTNGVAFRGFPSKLQDMLLDVVSQCWAKVPMVRVGGHGWIKSLGLPAVRTVSARHLLVGWLIACLRAKAVVQKPAVPVSGRPASPHGNIQTGISRLYWPLRGAGITCEAFRRRLVSCNFGTVLSLEPNERSTPWLVRTIAFIG
jgi:hypothetical protein